MENFDSTSALTGWTSATSSELYTGFYYTGPYTYTAIPTFLLDISGQATGTVLVDFKFIQFDTWDYEHFKVGIATSDATSAAETVDFGTYRYNVANAYTGTTTSGIDWSSTPLYSPSGPNFNSHAATDNIHQVRMEIPIDFFGGSGTMKLFFEFMLSSATSDESGGIAEFSVTACTV